MTVAIIDDYETSIEADCATEEEREADEDAACAKDQAAEHKYINTHEAWVDEMLRGCSASTTS